MPRPDLNVERALEAWIAARYEGMALVPRDGGGYVVAQAGPGETSHSPGPEQRSTVDERLADELLADPNRACE